jgi:hypothetical protein
MSAERSYRNPPEPAKEQEQAALKEQRAPELGPPSANLNDTNNTTFRKLWPRECGRVFLTDPTEASPISSPQEKKHSVAEMFCSLEHMQMRRQERFIICKHKLT